MGPSKMGIKKVEINRYLKSLVLYFGEGWFMYQGTGMLRLNGLLLQGVMLERSHYLNEFAPTYFVMVLSEPRGDYFIHFTLGDRLKDPRGGDMGYSLPLPLDRSYYTEKEIRTRWRDVRFTAEDKPDPAWLYEAIRAEAKPRIDAPLTMETVRDYLRDDKRGNDHFAVLWSRGIVEGLLGDMDEARKWLGKSEQVLVKNEKSWHNQPVPDSLVTDLAGLRQMLDHTTDPSEFRRYCEEIAARNKEKLELPTRSV